MDSCFIDASGTSGACEFYFQGGMYGWHITNTVIAMNGPALHAFDMHDGVVVRNCTLSGVNTVRWTDEFSRGVWVPGAVSFTNNIVSSWGGTLMTFDPTLAVAGAFTADYNLYWQGSGGSIPKLLSSDAHARYGDPLFVVASKGPTFDPHLRTGSAAIDLLPGGGDAGAFQHDAAPPGPDTIGPASVLDLR
jgi:hypothetical protein